MTTIQFQLSEEHLKEFQGVMYQVALEAVEKAKKSASVDIRYMSKKETCDYMGGLAYLTLEKWIQQGLKVIKINQKVYIDRLDLDAFLMIHKK